MGERRFGVFRGGYGRPMLRAASVLIRALLGFTVILVGTVATVFLADAVPGPWNVLVVVVGALATFAAAVSLAALTGRERTREVTR